MSVRIGMLTPSSNTVLEPVTARLAASLADSLTVHYSRFSVTTISDEHRSHRQFDPGPMVAAAALLGDARVNLIVWNGTSGAWEGLEKDRELTRLIEHETGIPATTATLSLLEALRHLQVKRYGLVVPYVDTVTEKIKATLGAEGFRCSAGTNERITTNFDFAAVGENEIVDRIREVARSSPDAIVVHCTNLYAAGVVDRLEAELGIPILDSVVVAFWGALRRLGLTATVQGFGQLLATPGH